MNKAVCNKVYLPPQDGKLFGVGVITFEIKVQYSPKHEAGNGATLGEGGKGMRERVVGGLWDLKHSQ